jgi:hypothetical protein
MKKREGGNDETKLLAWCLPYLQSLTAVYSCGYWGGGKLSMMMTIELIIQCIERAQQNLDDLKYFMNILKCGLRNYIAPFIYSTS